MKPAALSLLAILFTISCKPKTGDTAEHRLREENFDLKKENDSLKLIIEKAQRTYEGDTIQKLADPGPKDSEASFAGKHNLTLQWISWDKPGSVMITPSENGWYNIQGSQINKESYLKIEGKIRPITEQELEFDGKIEHNIHTGSGQTCIKTGKQVFKATGTRKYWRLQNMLSCDGTTTDYVDIYF